MKKAYLLTTVISFLTLTTSAQIKKGSILLGGQISYYNSRIDWNTSQPDHKYKSGNFNISAGTALKENSVLGLYFTYGHHNVTNNYNGNVYNNSKGDRYNFGVLFRQYKKLAKDFYFFGELGAGYLGSNQTDTELPGNNKTKFTRSGGELYLTPGISYRIYKKLHVELLIPQIATVQYAVLKTNSLTNNSKEDQFSFNTNLNSTMLNNIGLGFRFVL